VYLFVVSADFTHHKWYQSHLWLLDRVLEACSWCLDSWFEISRLVKFGLSFDYILLLEIVWGKFVFARR
jgi:hypothetical protein